MTEAEAYKMLCWPPEGELLALVLPLSGCDRTDWGVYFCSGCPMRGVSVPEARDENCVACGNQLVPYPPST